MILVIVDFSAASSAFRKPFHVSASGTPGGSLLSRKSMTFLVSSGMPLTEESYEQTLAELEYNEFLTASDLNILQPWLFFPPIAYEKSDVNTKGAVSRFTSCFFLKCPKKWPKSM
jgi:hypothetical protein